MRNILAIIVLLCCMPLIGATPQGGDDFVVEVISKTGSVEEINPTYIRVRDASGAAHNYIVDDETKFINFGALADLQPKDRVKIYFADSDNQKVLTSIEKNTHQPPSK